MDQLFTVLPAVLKEVDHTPKADESVVFAAWRRAAGEPLSRRAVPVEYADKRLVVAVEDKTWQKHMQELAPQLVARVNEAVGQGTVEYIEFRVGS
jgi:predicted nucleic acid-binding Zn ribbon protein